MDTNDEAGAVAAATYFLELYPYVYNTGDLTAWEAMSDPECVFCASVIENVETQSDSGVRTQGLSFDISDRSSDMLGPDRFSAVIIAIQSSSESVDERGEVVSTNPEPQDVTMTFALRFGDEGWSVLGVEPSATS